MRYKLGEIFNLQMGKTPDRHSPKFWNEGTEPWISIADLTKCIKYIENTAEKITATAVDESGIKIIPKNTVIMSFKLSIGKVAITPKEMYSNEAIMSFIDKGVLKIEPVYLYYLLMHKDWDTGTNKAVMGKTLNKATLSQMTVNIHGYSEQLEIIKALDTASSIITARKQQLAELDKLIKTRFVEMFGDPVDNDRAWATETLNSVCSTIVDCPHSTPSYTSDNTGYMCIRTSIVKKNHIMWDEIEYIPEQEYYQRIQRKRPERGDVIYTREGAILGIAAMIDRECNVALGQRSMLLSPNAYKCLPQFLSAAMNFDSFLRKVLGGVSGSASPHINVGDIKAFAIILPPIELQEQFAAFVEQVDKSKVAVQKALDEAQLLFDSLMQKYFG